MFLIFTNIEVNHLSCYRSIEEESDVNTIMTLMVSVACGKESCLISEGDWSPVFGKHT